MGPVVGDGAVVGWRKAGIGGGSAEVKSGVRRRVSPVFLRERRPKTIREASGGGAGR